MADLDVIEAALRSAWKRLPAHASKVLSTTVELGRPEFGRDAKLEDKVYRAILEPAGEGSGSAEMVLDLRVAIAAAGTMVMMPESAIAEKLSSGDFDDDDRDALGECVNQLLTVINDTLKDELPDAPRLVFKRAAIEGDDAVEDPLSLCGSMKIGEHDGMLELLIPCATLGAPSPSVDAGAGGVELSPEELAALREATADLGSGVIYLLVPIERAQSAWSSLLEEAGVEHEFVASVYSLQQAVREGRCAAVVVDADACPGGGLSALARLRDQLPTVVAASAPTRTHVVRCLAAGAKAYVPKPDSPTAMAELLQLLGA